MNSIADGHEQTVDDAVKRARAAQVEVLSVSPKSSLTALNSFRLQPHPARCLTH